MSTGRRCPNAALPGSRYCGLESHQALANQPTDEVDPAVDPDPPEAVPAPVEVPAEDALDDAVEETS
jgi:N utilization substance protein A